MPRQGVEDKEETGPVEPGCDVRRVVDGVCHVVPAQKCAIASLPP
jgi:hypothetical protein